MQKIFLSSTFRDFQVERDYIRNIVQPLLTEHCRKFLETVSFIDLRWGINTDDSDVLENEKKVLSVCLSEIDKSKPFMIVLIGNRYGTRLNSEIIEHEAARRNLLLRDYDKWAVTDETVIDGRQFFLMASQKYGNEADYAVVDDQGRQAADDTGKGFDEDTIRQIRDYIQAQNAEKEIRPDGKPKLETYQKYYENGEYLRSAESYGEQNFDMIDGRVNNRPKDVKQKAGTETSKEAAAVPDKPVTQKAKKIENRRSVLERLKEKQKEIAVRYGKNVPEQGNAERNRK